MIERLEKLGCNRQWLLFGTVEYKAPDTDLIVKEKGGMFFSMPGNISEKEAKRLKELFNLIATAPAGERERLEELVNIFLRR